MGFVKKHASDINDTRKSIHKEVERAAKNPDVWKAAALIAAPYALGAMSMSGAAGGGFLTTWGTGAKAIGGIAKAGLTKAFSAGKAGVTKMFGGVMDSATGLAKNLGLGDKLKDPGFMGDLFKRAISNLGGAAMAGDGLSDAEKQLMEQMTADLGKLRDQDEGLFNQQVSVANEVIDSGRSIDPEQVGLKAQRDVQIADAVTTRQADRDAKMREGGRGLSAADRRKGGLDTTRAGQSAYLEGLESGKDKKVKTMAAGAALLPKKAPTQGLSASMDLADIHGEHNERRRTAAADVGTGLGGMGNSKSQGDGIKDTLEDAAGNAVKSGVKKILGFGKG